MKNVTASEFSTMSAPELRMSEVRYLFDRFKAARNSQPNCGLFLLTVYFDSLLFCVISIEEMVEPGTRRELRSLNSFSFLKALRNITGHHSILSSSSGKFDKPVSRVVSVGVGCTPEFSEQLVLRPEKMKAVLQALIAERPQERYTVEKARQHLAALQENGSDLFLVKIIEEAIAEVESVAEQ